MENDYDVTVGTGRASAMEYAYYLKGEIDNLRFWKRALSLEEINADKVDEMPASEGLVAAYDFDCSGCQWKRAQRSTCELSG